MSEEPPAARMVHSLPLFSQLCNLRHGLFVNIYSIDVKRGVVRILLMIILTAHDTNASM